MAGKALSRKTTAKLKAAHKLLAKVLTKADPADLADPVDPSVLAAPDGTEGGNFDPYGAGAAGALDATGSRHASRIYTVTVTPSTRSAGNLETR